MEQKLSVFSLKSERSDIDMTDYQFYIDGEWRNASSNEWMEVKNPANGEIVGRVPRGTADDMNAAVAAAKAAFPAWNETSVEERTALLKKVRDGIVDRQDEIADIIVQELGAPISLARSKHVQQPIKEMDDMFDDLENVHFEEDIDGTQVVKEGFGVVACVTPWNFPLTQIERKIGPALIAGNTVVVKPATDTPITAVLLAEICEEAGLPKGVFNLVTGQGSQVGDVLTEHKDVDVISFTGSTEVGRHLYQHASFTIKKLILELGGKSPLIYMPGGDLDYAVKKSMDTVVNNCGQTCSALTRLLVPRKELEAANQSILNYYEKNEVIGDPTDTETLVGPVVTEPQKETVESYIQKGKEEGARVLVGGGKIDREGHYVEPTVFTDVDNKMVIAQEEIFGPVLCVIPYDSLEEAIEIANDTEYGLSGAVVGPSDEEAIAVARKIRTGSVYINKSGKSNKAPYGGYKQSGIGRENGRYGVQDYLEIKSIYK